MVANTPSQEDWQKLYDLMIQVKTLAPWEWMRELDVFGVQHPDTEELGFVSVMGMVGEHYAVAVYLGAEGLYGFIGLETSGPNIDMQQFFEVPQLQAAFEDRNELHARDRKIIRDLGLKFRGKQAWPTFRSHRPGCYPWFLEAAEARFLIVVLEQLVDVAPRLKANPSLFNVAANDQYFARVPVHENDTVTWEDRIIQVAPPESPMLELTMNLGALEALKKLPQGKQVVEMDFFIFPSPIQEERNARPAFPYVLLSVDGASGMILGTELLSPLPSLQAMWELIPETIVVQLANAGVRPQIVRVQSDLLAQLLQPLVEELGFNVVKRSRLSRLEPARAGLTARFSQGF